MKKAFLLIVIIFSGLFNLSGQNVEYFNIDSLYHIVDSLYKNNADEELILEKVSLILKSDTCNANLWSYKGSYYDKMGEYEAAKYYYSKAISVDSLHFETLYNLGVLYYNEGVLELEATKGRTRKQFLESTYISSKKFSLSTIFFERAFAVNPDYHELINMLRLLKRLSIANDNESNIVIDLSEEHEMAYIKTSDTTNYYVVFETAFFDSNVRIYCNDSLIFKDKITTDESIDHAATIKVGDVEKVKKISIRIEDAPLTVIYPMKGKYYIRIRCLERTGVFHPYIIIRFSRYNVWRR